MRRFLLLVALMLALVAAASAQNLRTRRQLQEERDGEQGSEDGVDVDKSVKNGERTLGAGDNHDPNHAGHDDHAGHNHRTLGAGDNHDPNHAGHDDHAGHNHRTLGAAADDHDPNHAGHDDHVGHNHLAAAEEDKQADPRAGLCKMPGQSPCPNGPGTCTLLFCDCSSMTNCRYIDPPKL